MATHLRDTTSAQDAADICASIAGSLASDDTTKHLAQLWEGLTSRGDALALEHRSLMRTLGRTRARAAVADAAWDPEVAAFGRDVNDRSDGKRDKAPNTRFFGQVTASEAQDFGIDREIKQGERWLAELNRDPNEDLAQKWIPRLKTVNDALDTASTDRKNAMRDVAVHGTAEALYIEDINLEIDRLEGDLLKLFPGQPKRVAAFLEPTRVRRKRGGSGEDSGGEG